MHLDFVHGFHEYKDIQNSAPEFYIEPTDTVFSWYYGSVSESSK